MCLGLRLWLNQVTLKLLKELSYFCNEILQFSDVIFDEYEIETQDRGSAVDGFIIDALPTASLTLGEFADQKPNVKIITRGFYIEGIWIAFIVFVTFAILVSVFCWRYFYLRKLFSFYIFSNIF